jgi:hypothetical protein
MLNLQLKCVGANPMLQCNESSKGKSTVSTTVTVTGLPIVKTPRGAVWAARGAVAVWAAASRWLDGRKQQSLANQAAIEARRVRAMARHHVATDPGFAADLMAAADRHEAQQGR